jgi:hypothetical protein
MLKTYHLVQGDAFSLKAPLLVDGIATAIEGWQCWFTVKRSPSDADESAMAQKTLGDGISAYDAVTWLIELDPADTQSGALGRYQYDIQAKSPDGKIFTLEKGYLFLDSQITRASS